MASAEASGSSSSPVQDFESRNADLQTAALKATKLAAGLPVDLDYHRSLDKQFAQALDSCSEKVLDLSNKLLSFISTAERSSSSKGKGKRKLEDEDDVVDKFNSVVVDDVDQLFEQADRGLDEYLGRLKPAAIEVKPQENKARKPAVRKNKLETVITHASYLAKPQLKFKRTVDNSNERIWLPTISHKYNAQVPLGYNLRPNDIETEPETELETPHPYRYEISNISYPSRMFEHADPPPVRTFEETAFTWIDTKEGLDQLLEKLRSVEEIAVDLEHHSYRTFSGFLCLMQISTRAEDFIIDTLALRDELEELNEVFTNPRIVKVFHGASSDILWLQQDFNLYIVNLFDTYHASKVLEFPKHGLAALLEMYCDFIPDKRYQLADWRIRPLPKEMLDYARSDTHYLLYIYDSLRNALLDRAHGASSLVREVLSRSQETALRTYQREVYDFETGSGPNGWDTLAQKWNKSFAGLNLAVYKCVHAWRDRVARQEDESLRYVLPNHYIFQLAEQPPAGMASLLGVFHPTPQVVRTRSAELLQAIQLAAENFLSKESDGLTASAVDVDMPPTEAEASFAVEIASMPPSASVPTVEMEQSLWSNQSKNKAPTSTLLGAPVRSGGYGVPWMSHSSALFSPAPSLKAMCPRNQLQQWKDVVLQIHRELVVTPTLPAVTVASSSTEPKAFEVVQESEATVVSAAAQAEIPFVPSTQRQKQLVEVDDTIVVVGQARQKKRKRAKDSKVSADNESKESATPEASQPDTKKAKRKDQPPPVEEPFDYASIPNILDDSAQRPSSALPSGKKDRTKKKDAQNGNFPRPPKAMSEQKGGNITRTFR